jgi:hypothetical protein
MTFEVGGKQYVAILSGLSPIAPAYAHAGAARDAQPDHAVRVRAVSNGSVSALMLRHLEA